jgi:glutathione S-transferase
MPSYRLHYFPESGNSYKLALMLTLCGQTFEPVWTDFGGGVTRTPEWRRDVNAMGEIPVLEVDGERLTQTAPILLMLAKQFGRFGAETEHEHFELLRWLFWDNHKLTGYMATYRYLRAETLSQAYRRLSVDPRAAHAEECIRDRRAADGGRHIDDGLSALSRGRDRL